MTSIWKKIILTFLLLLVLPFLSRSFIYAQTTDECQSMSGQQKVDCYSRKVNDLQSQANTLSSQIAVMDNQVKLTEARIASNQQQITDLTLDIDTTDKKIDGLQNSLENLSLLLVNRIKSTYIVGTTQPFQILLSSGDASNFLTRLNYLRIAQQHDKKLIVETAQAKNDYENQKDILEDKKKQIETLKKQLDAYNAQLLKDKASKQSLLAATKNDEARYQRLLEEARAERAVVLGGGKETFLRNVSTGDSIGTVITGASGCSSGRHLHFSIYQGTSMRDPNDYLSSKSFTYDYPDSQYGYYGTINPHGSYPWPIDDPIFINQGYGAHTFAQQFYPSKFHDGIDMDGGSLNVKAVREGKLYAGTYSCSNGPLTYAKLEHSDGLISWYLHIYPN